MASTAVPERAGMQQVGDAPEGIDGTLLTFTELVNKHAKFLNETAKLQVYILILLLSIVKVKSLLCRSHSRKSTCVRM
jgi:hypothetical protein